MHGCPSFVSSFVTSNFSYAQICEVFLHILHPRADLSGLIGAHLIRVAAIGGVDGFFEFPFFSVDAVKGISLGLHSAGHLKTVDLAIVQGLDGSVVTTRARVDRIRTDFVQVFSLADAITGHGLHTKVHWSVISRSEFLKFSKLKLRDRLDLG